MTKQRAEINGSGAKIRSIAEFLINGVNGSFTHFDRKKKPKTAASCPVWLRVEEQRSNMHNECESAISLDHKPFASMKFIFKQLYDPQSKVRQTSLEIMVKHLQYC